MCWTFKRITSRFSGRMVAAAELYRWGPDTFSTTTHATSYSGGAAKR